MKSSPGRNGDQPLEDRGLLEIHSNVNCLSCIFFSTFHDTCKHTKHTQQINCGQLLIESYFNAQLSWELLLIIPAASRKTCIGSTDEGTVNQIQIRVLIFLTFSQINLFESFSLLQPFDQSSSVN